MTFGDSREAGWSPEGSVEAWLWSSGTLSRPQPAVTMRAKASELARGFGRRKESVRIDPILRFLVTTDRSHCS